jgi:hypothetical protein
MFALTVNSEHCGLAMPADMHAAKQSDSYYASVMFLRPEIAPLRHSGPAPLGPIFPHGRYRSMDVFTRKPRRVETSEERATRLEEEARKALNRALAEQDAVDAMIRRSIQLHGP